GPRCVEFFQRELLQLIDFCLETAWRHEVSAADEHGSTQPQKNTDERRPPGKTHVLKCRRYFTANVVTSGLGILAELETGNWKLAYVGRYSAMAARGQIR